MSEKIKVGVVDDSAVVRQTLLGIINSDPEMEICFTAQDPIFAFEHMQKQWPDVLIVDIEMPRMDGLTFLRQIMAQRPTPTIICSVLTEKGSQMAMDALGAGAVDIVTKPKLGLKDFLSDSALTLLQTIRAAANANMRNAKIAPVSYPATSEDVVDFLPHSLDSSVIAIGASTGGTYAIETILSGMNEKTSPIVIVQHMPPKFTALFADRLNRQLEIEMREAQDGDILKPGLALLAPGDFHLCVAIHGGQSVVRLNRDEPRNHHRPSVDVLFESIRIFGVRAMGILLTGMGNDGAQGLLEIKNAGGQTIAQDKASSVVYGMPGEAVRLGAALQELPVGSIPEAMRKFSARFRPS